MADIRILLVHPGGVLADIVRVVLESQHGIHVVGQLTDQRGVPDALARTGAQCIIWGLDEADMPDLWPRLLDTRPRTTVIAVDRDGREAFLWRMELRRTPIGEVSPARLVEAIRTAVER